MIGQLGPIKYKCGSNVESGDVVTNGYCERTVRGILAGRSVNYMEGGWDGVDCLSLVRRSAEEHHEAQSRSEKAEG